MSEEYETKLEITTEEGIDFIFHDDGLVEVRADKKLVQLNDVQWAEMMQRRRALISGD